MHSVFMKATGYDSYICRFVDVGFPRIIAERKVLYVEFYDVMSTEDK